MRLTDLRTRTRVAHRCPHTLSHTHMFSVCLCVWNALELIEMGKAADNNNQTTASKKANKNKNSEEDEEKETERERGKSEEPKFVQVIVNHQIFFVAFMRLCVARLLCDKQQSIFVLCLPRHAI